MKSLAFDPHYFGARGDGITNDAVAVRAALDAGAALGRPVAFRAGHTYKVNASLFRSNLVDIEGNGATLDMTGSSQAAAACLTTLGPKRNSYCQNVTILGPGGKSIGLNHATAGGTYRSIYMSALGTGVRIASDNTYLITFDDVVVFGYSVAGFSCATALNNSGENIRWIGGGIYNGAPGAVGIDNQGCEFNAWGISIDFPGDSFIRNATIGSSGPGLGTASTQLMNAHLETRGVFPNGDPVIDVGAGPGLAGVNGWSRVIIRDSAIINDTGGIGPTLVRNNGAGAWVLIADSLLAAWSLTPTGIGVARVHLRNYTDGLTPFLNSVP